MINKAINHLVFATVDSLTKFKNKLAYYLAIFAMVFGSTFGSINSAFALDRTTDLAVIADAAITDGGTTITFDGDEDDVLTITPVADIVNTGAVTTAVTENGSIIFVGVTTIAPKNNTFNAAVGTSTKTLNAITIGTTALGGAATFDSNVFAKTITLVSGDQAQVAGEEAATGTFKGNVTATTGIVLTEASVGRAIANFTGAVDQTITGAITATVTGDGAIVVNNTTGKKVTFANNIGVVAGNQVRDVTVSDAKSAEFQGTVSALSATLGAGSQTTFLNDGNKIGVGPAGALTFGGTNTVINVGRGVTAGETLFDLTGAIAGAGGAVVTATTFTLPSNFTTGDIKLIDTGTNLVVSTDELALMTARDTPLTSFAITHTTVTSDVTVTATAKSDATTASELGVNTNKATGLRAAVLAAATQGTDTTLIDAFTTVLNAGTTTDTDVANQVAPQSDTISGSAIATRAMTGTVQGIVSNRMASLRSGDAFVTGMSAGNGMSANSGFIQAFGSEAEQKNTGPTTAKVYGYDSQTSGVAIGFDGMTETGETIGLSASFSTTDVDGKGTGKSKNAIDSYTVSVYADKATEKGYIEGSLTYGINDNTSSRLVNTAGLSRTYAGNYDSEQISLKVGGGVPNEVIDGTFVTPFASATGTIISTDSYTETSTTANDALRLKIAQDDINSLVGTIGVKAHMITDKGTPMISFAINNEFGDTTINSTNTYTGGGTAFKTSTDVEELSATLGLGYSFGNDVSSVNIGYEANANEDDYLSHYGTVKIISKF